MSQLYILANLDKKQYVNPHNFGGGASLASILGSNPMLSTGLVLLLKQSSEPEQGSKRGFDADPLLGSWAGDRITVVSDLDESATYNEAFDEWDDISLDLIVMMCKETYMRNELRAHLGWLVSTLPSQQARVLNAALLGLKQSPR